MENVQALKEQTGEIVNLGEAQSLLGWDQQTNMPPEGARARANQLATLSKVIHTMSTSDEMGELIERAGEDVKDLPEDHDDRKLVEVSRRDYEQATRLPTDFVADFTRTTSLAHEVWAKARQDNDYESFRPELEKIVELCIQRAEYLGYEDHIYDALLDQFEPEMKTADVDRIFGGLREDLVPFALELYERKDMVSDEPLHREFLIEDQRRFGLKVVKQIGYDLSRGRQDEAVHPFCTSFSSDDVRITTRFDKNFLSPALFGTIHEAGHATYEQGIGRNLFQTVLGTGVSLGVHESQSRLWENVVARSRGFWEYFYPSLRETFNGVLDDVSLDDFYRAVNKVQPSFIRVEADEVSYCLHIMLRFDLEKDLLTGKLAVKDAPEAWNAKMEKYLGIVPETDTLGILQDVHWSSGILGYFPTYALGTLLSAQLYYRALEDHPEIPDEIRQGKFGTLLTWMNDNIHVHGRKYMPAELIQRATGKPLGHEDYMTYLHGKFGPIYNL
jgi:carboxypeptidase Taq